MGPERLRDRGSEPVRLDQHRHERLDVLDAGPVTEVPERLIARRSRPDLQIDEADLFAEDGTDALDFFRDAYHRLVQPEAGLDAYHEKIERVRQRFLHLLLAPGDA